MVNRREWEDQWRQIVSLLQRGQRSVAVSLAKAEQLFAAAPDATLPAPFAQSVVSQVLYHRSEQRQAADCCWLGNLICSADALAWAEARWVAHRCMFGVYEGGGSAEGVTVVRSDCVDASRLAGPRLAPAWELSPSATDSIVYDVSPGCHELARAEFRRVRQSTLRSDAFLDGRGLDAGQYGFRRELWCDGTGHEQDNRARIGDN